MVWVALILGWGGLVYAERDIYLAPVEFHGPLYDQNDEFVSFKCNITNPSPVTMTFNISYWNGAAADTNQYHTPPAETVLGNTMLNTNQSYTFYWCRSPQMSNCQENAPIGGTNIPSMVKIHVVGNTGFLVGSCVSHYGKGANYHRSSAVAIAGGRPF